VNSKASPSHFRIIACLSISKKHLKRRCAKRKSKKTIFLNYSAPVEFLKQSAQVRAANNRFIQRTTLPTHGKTMHAWMLKWAIPASLLTFGAVGCQHAASSYPSDPLLVCKKPIDARPVLKPPALLSYGEPEVPAGPVEATASQPHQDPGPSAAVTATRPTVRGQAP
jgi:hypothetical protein